MEIVALTLWACKDLELQRLLPRTNDKAVFIYFYDIN